MRKIHFLIDAILGYSAFWDWMERRVARPEFVIRLHRGRGYLVYVGSKGGIYGI